MPEPLAGLFIFSVVFAFSFLMTVRWVRIGDHNTDHAPERTTP
jgi:hypothetical protein